ncbi:MAG: type II secretion system F family protein [Acidimicrobiales bacterium]
MMPLGVLVCGAVFAIGLLGLILFVGRPDPDRDSDGDGAGDRDVEKTQHHLSSQLRARLPKMTLAVGVGILSGLATGWLVAVPIGTLAALGLPVLFGRTSGSVTVEKIEAVATWTEMLQGTLAASAGLSQAIVATAPLSPSPIRKETRRLAALLEAGAQPREALLRFAEEVADPSTDRVVCALLLSYQSRGQRLGELLAALAESTRDEVALRLRIETSRASVRSSVRTVLVFSVAFAVALVVLAHSYLAPFGTPTGQLVLLIIGSLYAIGLSMMVTLARPPAPVRLLGRHVVRR